jgi:hypothetical protein
MESASRPPRPPTPPIVPPTDKPIARDFPTGKLTRPVHAKDVREFPLGEAEVLLFAEGRQVVHTLNVSAWAIWGLCDGVRTVEEIAAQLAADLRMSADIILPDVIATVTQLGSLGLLDAA